MGTLLLRLPIELQYEVIRHLDEVDIIFLRLASPSLHEIIDAICHPARANDLRTIANHQICKPQFGHRIGSIGYYDLMEAELSPQGERAELLVCFGCHHLLPQTEFPIEPDDLRKYQPGYIQSSNGYKRHQNLRKCIECFETWKRNHAHLIGLRGLPRNQRFWETIYDASTQACDMFCKAKCCRGRRKLQYDFVDSEGQWNERGHYRTVRMLLGLYGRMESSIEREQNFVQDDIWENVLPSSLLAVRLEVGEYICRKINIVEKTCYMGLTGQCFKWERDIPHLFEPMGLTLHQLSQNLCLLRNKFMTLKRVSKLAYERSLTMERGATLNMDVVSRDNGLTTLLRGSVRRRSEIWTKHDFWRNRNRKHGLLGRKSLPSQRLARRRKKIVKLENWYPKDLAQAQTVSGIPWNECYTI